MTHSDPNRLFALLRSEQHRKEQHKAALKDALVNGTIPVPEDVLDALSRLFVTDAIEVLRAHPGFVLESKFQSLRTTFRIFNQATADLLAALYQFDRFSRTEEFSYRAHRGHLDEIEARIRKEIFSFSTLAHSLRDHSRGLCKDWSPPGIEERLLKCFRTDGMHEFVCALRNAMHHAWMIEADWLIKNSGPDATSHYVFDKVELQFVGKGWNARARQFLDSASGRIDVGELVREYSARVCSFYDWLLNLCEHDAPVAVQDYRKCWLAHRRRDARMAWRFFLTELVKRKVDPFAHLSKYLTSAEMEQAMRLPMRSRQQVDFVIRVVDEHGACDDEVQHLAYQLFGINTISESAPALSASNAPIDGELRT